MKIGDLVCYLDFYLKQHTGIIVDENWAIDDYPDGGNTVYTVMNSKGEIVEKYEKDLRGSSFFMSLPLRKNESG